MDAELRAALEPNRYIHETLADPDAKYVVMAERDLQRMRDLAKKLGISEEFKALDIEVIPYEINTEE